MPGKKCSKCGETKSLDQFSKNASTADQLERWCKDCKKAQQQIYCDKKLAEKKQNGRKQHGISKVRPIPESTPKTDEAILIPPEAIKAIQRAVAKQIINIIERAFA